MMTSLAHAAKWLASAHGIRDIVLLSHRTMASHEAETLESDLAQLGTSTIVIDCWRFGRCSLRLKDSDSVQGGPTSPWPN